MWSAILLVAAATPPSTVRFVDVTEASGVDFVHENGATVEKYLVETMGSGGGFFDYDGDGDLDLYLVNGASLPGSAPVEATPTNRLYRNDGAGSFEDVTEQAGVGDTAYGMGMTAADVDNDGDTDLYVTNFGRNVLYRNMGDGTFVDVTDEAGVAAGEFSSSAAFADFDADGFVDLYVAQYVDFSLDNHKFCGNQARKIRAYCHPDVYNPVPGILYRNRGDGSFEDVTEAAGVLVTAEGKGLGVVWGDYDGDGDVDLYVANDSMRNFLFQNDGEGHFADVTLLAGVGYSEDGQTQAGMGTDMADYDGDGLLDLVVTNLDFEYNALYKGSASGIFFDTSYEAGIAETSLNRVGFGALFFDYDMDGRLDLFVANGHIIDNIEAFGSVSTYREPNFLFRNEGEGVFREVAAELGDALVAENVARGAAYADVDGDLDLDLLVTRCGGPPLLARNDGPPGSRAGLVVTLIGTDSNRDAVGARVTVRTGERTFVREVKAGSSYLSQSALSLYFGLGGVSRPDAIAVRWPSGTVQEIDPSVAEGALVIVEGREPFRAESSAVLTFK